MTDDLCEICERPALISIAVTAFGNRRSIAVCALHYQLLTGDHGDIQQQRDLSEIGVRVGETLQRAVEFALRSGSSQVDSGHLLYTLPENEKVRAILRRFRLSIDDMRQHILEAATKAVKLPEDGEAFLFSLHVKRAIRHGFSSARELGNTELRPEHLLLGLAEEPESTAGALLARYGLTIQALRQQIMRVADDASADQFLPTTKRQDFRCTVIPIIASRESGAPPEPGDPESPFAPLEKTESIGEDSNRSTDPTDRLLDEELEQSFPASDPPTITRGNNALNDDERALF